MHGQTKITSKNPPKSPSHLSRSIQPIRSASNPQLIISSMTSSLFNRLEAQDFSAFSSPPSGKSESRGWSSLHYACQSRLISGIISSLSLRRPESLTDLGKDQNRACDLLPVPELSHFNLYSFGFASDYQLGYAKEKQLIPKKIDFHSLQDQFEYYI